MTALDFPNSPVYDETYSKYRWDGEKWVPGYTVLPSTAWTPANGLTGLIGWWDMQVPGSITISTTKVVYLADQSGAGNTIGNGIDNVFKPVYSATGLNGFPALSFLNQGELDRAGFPMGTGNTLTVFAVATMSSSTENYGRMFCFGATGFQDNNSVGSWTVLRDGTTQKVWFQRNGISPTSNSIYAYNAPFRYIATINSSGVMTIYVNGVATATATQAGSWIGSGQFRIGGDFLGSQWYGMVGEVGVATGFSNSTSVASLDTYLKNKWGPFWSLTRAYPGFTSNQNGMAGTNIRQVIAPAQLAYSGSKVRMTLYSSFAAPCTLSNVYIGHGASSGDTYDFDGNQIQLTFSGSASVTIPANTGVVSDVMNFALDKTKNFVISMYFNGTGSTRIVNAAGTTRGWAKVTADEASATNVASDYVDYGGYNWCVGEIEVAV